MALGIGRQPFDYYVGGSGGQRAPVFIRAEPALGGRSRLADLTDQRGFLQVTEHFRSPERPQAFDRREQKMRDLSPRASHPQAPWERRAAQAANAASASRAECGI